MADYAKKIRTDKGDLQIDYNALANLPDLGAINTKITTVQTELDSKANTTDVNNLQSELSTLKKTLASKADSTTVSSIQTELSALQTEVDDKLDSVTPDEIGAAKTDLSNVTEETIRDAVVNSGAGGIPIVDAISSDGIAYTATVPGMTELINGMIITIIPNRASDSSPFTLDVNGLGAMPIHEPMSSNSVFTFPLSDGTYLSAYRPVTLQCCTSGINSWKIIGKQLQVADELYGTVPISGGGTGASDAAAARQNLGIPTFEWDSSTATLNITTQ